MLFGVSTLFITSLSSSCLSVHKTRYFYCLISLGITVGNSGWKLLQHRCNGHGFSFLHIPVEHCLVIFLLSAEESHQTSTSAQANITQDPVYHCVAQWKLLFQDMNYMRVSFPNYHLIVLDCTEFLWGKTNLFTLFSCRFSVSFCLYSEL